MITLHHLNHSRSQRILWFLEELGVTYDIVTHLRDPKTQLAPQSMREVFPLGRSPVVTIETDDMPPVTLAESGAIVEYLAIHYGDKDLRVAADDPKFADFLYWLHFSEGTLMPPLIAELVMNKAKAKKKPFFVSAIADKLIDAIMDAYYRPNGKANLDFVERHLQRNFDNSSSFFIADRFTIIDIMMLFPLEAIVATLGAQTPSAIRQYVQTMQARPAYLSALDKGGDYQFGPSRAA
jgi:glutathione S-transferase